MSKKDYIIIADAIIEARREYMRTFNIDEQGNEMLWSIITCLSVALKNDNTKFNQDTFEDYIERNL